MSSDSGSQDFRSGAVSTEDKRYVVMEEQAGTWQIIDSATGLPAATDGKEFVQLAASDAKDIADELNRCDAEGIESPLL